MMVRVDYNTAIDLGIPVKSRRGYSLHTDTMIVDSRCLRRYARRAGLKSKVIPAFDKYWKAKVRRCISKMQRLM